MKPYNPEYPAIPAPRNYWLGQDKTEQDQYVYQVSPEQVAPVDTDMVPDVWVKSFQDKYGHTRYLKQGINNETGYKFTSFITKAEAENLLSVDEKKTSDLLDQITQKTAPQFVLPSFSTDALRTLAKVDAMSHEELGLDPGYSKEDALQTAISSLTYDESDTLLAVKRFKREAKPRFGRLRRLGRTAMVQLGLAPDPDQGSPIDLEGFRVPESDGTLVHGLSVRDIIASTKAAISSERIRRRFPDTQAA